MIIGVVDTGIAYDHPDLAPNMWINTGEIPNDGIDNDGNGFIDDVNGYDFVNGDPDPMDAPFSPEEIRDMARMWRERSRRLGITASASRG